MSVFGNASKISKENKRYEILPNELQSFKDHQNNISLSNEESNGGNRNNGRKNLKFNSNPETTQLSFHVHANTQPFDLYKGILYMFISCIFRSIFSFLCKWSLNYNRDLTAFQQITIFNYFYFTITIFSFLFTGVSIFSDNFFNVNKLSLIILRNFLAICSLLLLTYSLKYMHISDVFSVFFIYPALVILLSIIFLGEKASWFDYLCCVSSFTGAILIVRPDFLFHDKEANTHYGYFILVTVAALLKSIVDVTTRFIGSDMNFQAINLSYSSIGMLVFPLIMVASNNPLPKLSQLEISVFFITGICAWMYQTFATIAFQNEKACRVSMINYIQVDFMYILDLLVFNKPLLFTDLLGSLLIFSFNFANGLYQTLKRIRLLNLELERRSYASPSNLNYDKTITNNSN